MGIKRHGEAGQGQRTDVGDESPWTQEKTAKKLNLSVGKVSESLKLYKAIQKHSEVREAYSKLEAIRRLKIIKGRSTRTKDKCHYCNKGIRKGRRARNIVLCADCYRERIKKPKEKQIVDALLEANSDE